MREAIARQGIYHPPVAAVTVAYPKDAFKDVELPNGFGALRELPGFGSLNPRTEGVRLGFGFGFGLGLGLDPRTEGVRAVLPRTQPQPQL